jgi:outer membrane protein assembly factor BamB
MHVRRVAVILAVAALSSISGGSPRGIPAHDGVRPHRILVLHPADGLGALVAGFGDLWVDDCARERLLRVDAQSGRVRAAIAVDGRVALATGAHDVWALESGGAYGLGKRGPLLRIDPRTEHVRARIPLRTMSGRSVLGFGVEAAGRDVWVWGPRDILRIDERAGRVTARIGIADAHGELTGFAAGARQLVAGTADGHLLRFDRRTLKRTSMLRVALRTPSPKALSDGYVLVTASGEVGAVELATGRVAWRRRLGFRAGATLGRDGLAWVHSAATHEHGDRVTAVRLATGEVVTTGILPAFGSTGIAAGAGRVAIASAGGSLLVFEPFAT